jgi:hypothetical protein
MDAFVMKVKIMPCAANTNYGVTRKNKSYTICLNIDAIFI